MTTERDLTEIVPDASVPLTEYEYHGYDDIQETQPGPTINGQPTQITLVSPARLAKTAFLSSMQHVINEAFRGVHVKTNVLPRGIDRVRGQQYLIDEIGAVPGTFTFIVHSNESEVLGTASMRPFRLVSTADTPDMTEDDRERARRHRFFYRLESLPPGVQGWELKLMAVAPEAQGHGLAALLISRCEQESLRRSEALPSKTHEVRCVLTCIAQINREFYLRRGFEEDYHTALPVGTMESETGFTILHMSKKISTR